MKDFGESTSLLSGAFLNSEQMPEEANTKARGKVVNSSRIEISSSRFVGDRPRHMTLALDWPIEFEGKTYTAIGLRRLTASDVAAFVDVLRAERDENAGAAPRAPIFVAEDGSSIPDGLFDLLDDDDALRLDQAAVDFLPRRFRMIEDVSAPSTGDDTEQTS